MRGWKRWIAQCVRALIALRYRVVVKGLEELDQKGLSRGGGILFLPNHPAEIDPVIVEAVLWKKFSPRPLIVEHFYYLKGFQWLMDLVGATPLPTMDLMATPRRAKKVKQQFDRVAEAVNRGENFLIYPSGKLKRTGAEKMGGASFVHDLLGACPTANVVLVRTTGLWGSLFSKALTGQSPKFGKALLRGLWILIKNGIFFAPKRTVYIEIESAPQGFPYQGTRLELNHFLEQWYNRYLSDGKMVDVEPLIQVSHTWWKKSYRPITAPPVDDKEEENGEEGEPIPAEIQNRVLAELSRLASRPAAQIDHSMSLAQDLGLDSLDLTELALFLDEHYEVKDISPGDVQLVKDVLRVAAGKHLGVKKKVVEPESRFVWPTELHRPDPCLKSTRTLQEAFLKNCDAMGAAIACVDTFSGALSYRRLKLAVLILADKMRSIPEEMVGVMMPSSVGAYCLILALLLARKKPVMINWTAGKKALDYAVELTGIQTVLTSERFLDRVEDPDLGKVEGMWLFLEQVRQSISLQDKIKAGWGAFQGSKALIRKWRLSSVDPEEAAVILFTSGTESLPKGVPLSHRNVLSNQAAALSCVTLESKDILYGVLPPFHSFGLSVTGLLPLLIGMKVCYSPDPTDSHAMARDVARWQPTLLCCAPSFIRALFQVSDVEGLRSLRWVVSGAEKTPQELFDYVARNLPESLLLEGYGITECSPIVSLDRPGEPHVGVGKPLPGIEILIFDSETLEEITAGGEGEIGIAGPNVFKGYLGSPRDPFVSVRGRLWYASGDRGRLDSEGHLILSGRLKRFVKIGGEMVSLGGIEESLLQLAQEKKWGVPGHEGPLLAITVHERETDKPQIILFTTFAMDREGVNALLKEKGFSRLVKIAEVRRIGQIPLMGTGKTNYRALDEIFRSSH